MADRTVRPPWLVGAALWDALAAAAIAAVLALPLLGFRLADSPQGLSLDYRLSWVAYAAMAVFLGRLLLSFGATALKRCPLVDVLPVFRFGWISARIASWVLVLFALVLPWLPFADRNVVDRATLILIYVMLGTGLNITVGLAGVLDLGYVAFYAVGAYSYALLSQQLGLSFWTCLPLSGFFAACFGLMVGFPVLRLRGDYLAIVTLGFGQIVRVILVNWTDLTGGPNGISGIERPSFFGLPFAASVEGRTTFAQFFAIAFSPAQRIYFLYYVMLAMVIAAALFVWWIRRLPLGRAFEALREDETACVSLGLNPTAIKLSAFALGAAIAGLAGSFFAARQGFISPESFTFTETAIILAIVVMGGMGSQLGIAAAAILLVGLPEWFRDLEQYRMVAFGAAMVLIMLWRPKGLTTRREPTLKLGVAPR
jgi:branched-chain amino acid transport system permease protein